MKVFFVLLLAFWLPAAAGTSASGFDEICTIYAEYEPSGNETVGEIWFLLGDEVDARVTSTEALQAYSAAELSNPKERYQLFEDAARAPTGKDWSCEPMKEILDSAQMR
jgi:hypothetical protein